jgi:alanine dehydrogenase
MWCGNWRPCEEKTVALLLVTETMVENMKNGAVIVDVSIDTGGCLKLQSNSHEKPTFIKVMFYTIVYPIFPRYSKTASFHQIS